MNTAAFMWILYYVKAITEKKTAKKKGPKNPSLTALFSVFEYNYIYIYYVCLWFIYVLPAAKRPPCGHGAVARWVFQRIEPSKLVPFIEWWVYRKTRFKTRFEDILTKKDKLFKNNGLSFKMGFYLKITQITFRKKRISYTKWPEVLFREVVAKNIQKRVPRCQVRRIFSAVLVAMYILWQIYPSIVR